MVNSLRKSYEDYRAAKLSAKVKPNQERANAYARFLKEDLRKGSICYIDLQNESTDAQEKLELARGEKILCNNKMAGNLPGVIVVNGKSDQFYNYLAVSEVILTKDVLSIYYINRENQYVGLDTDKFTELEICGFEQKMQWLKTLIKADFFITEDKEAFIKKVKELFGCFDNISRNIISAGEFESIYQSEAVEKLGAKRESDKKQLVLINDFSDNEKWFPVLHNYLQWVNMDEYQVTVISDCKELSLMEKYVETLDPRVRVLCTKGWAVVLEEERMKFNYVFAELLYLEDYQNVSQYVTDEMVGNEWKKNMGTIQPDRIIAFEVTNWKWLYYMNFFKEAKKEVVFDDYLFDTRGDANYAEEAKSNYYMSLSKKDQIHFLNNYDRKLVQNENSQYHQVKVGDVIFKPAKDINYWTAVAQNNHIEYVVYNDYWVENHYIDLVEEPNKDMTNNYMVIMDGLTEDNYNQLINYMEQHNTEELYLFDFTESYNLAFQEIVKKNDHVHYYTLPLFYYLLLDYMNEMISIQADEAILQEAKEQGKSIIEMK